MSEVTYPKLRGKMAEQGVTQTELAKVLGISQQAMVNKMGNRAGFSQKDMVKICNALGIPIEEVGLYFFYPNSLTS